MITLLLLAGLHSNLPQSTTALPYAQTPTTPLSTSTANAVQRFENAVSAEQSAYETLPIAGGVKPNLEVRIRLDQAMRLAIGPVTSTLSDADRQAASAEIWRQIVEVDAANTAYLKSVLPLDGWFRSRRDGADVAHNAWLIVQHSPDQAFQNTVIARMRPLVASGDARGSDYALLFDRTEMFAGRPQLYGSQVTCIDGRWHAAPTADPAGLDQRRAEMGLPPMSEYLKDFEEVC